jgi:hypothetical protein
MISGRSSLVKVSLVRDAMTMETTPTDRPPQAARLAPKLRALADQGDYFGTSSWKYEGWVGSIYTADRYNTRGKFSTKKFEAECLAEYPATFPIVGDDFSFYQFRSADYWQRLFEGSPSSAVTLGCLLIADRHP